ncbi:helix-turn-helix domain-containing protein [Tabrizicola sp. J26]|uniref:helix-turn-helix domain-containing protein n=1 Tax=Alitabrizicola rongguiensis TaxID=2909234 RepID=UPI001F3E1898|nr:helix-turn-helix transcriptional regulator [Tabrizicola rongguiensis]MCF1708842.1 helix-turn-helix domain-containing protein [Tabrizicola rongguiensis]
MNDSRDKRSRADLFRARLGEAMDLRGLSQSALARRVGVDRSTISQLLDPASARLPNAQVAAECAIALSVSADWLLGLTDRPELPDARLAEVLRLTDASRALIDETIFGWHQEAAGYKIRHVPATLPDMVKTRRMMEWEYGPQLGADAAQALATAEARLDWMRHARSDYEIAFPLHELEAFVRAEGYYAGLPLGVRLEQIDRLIALVDALYPSVRIYLFDARRIFSAPITIFGPFLAVIYLGSHYLALRDPERIAVLSRHFDGLVRDAGMAARDLPGHLRALRSSLTP